jgi:hypothetical protein
MDTDDLLFRIEQLEREVENLRDQILQEYNVEDLIRKALVDNGLIQKQQFWGDDW